MGYIFLTHSRFNWGPLMDMKTDVQPEGYKKQAMNIRNSPTTCLGQSPSFKGVLRSFLDVVTPFWGFDRETTGTPTCFFFFFFSGGGGCPLKMTHYMPGPSNYQQGRDSTNGFVVFGAITHFQACVEGPSKSYFWSSYPRVLVGLK